MLQLVLRNRNLGLNPFARSAPRTAYPNISRRRLRRDWLQRMFLQPSRMKLTSVRFSSHQLKSNNSSTTWSLPIGLRKSRTAAASRARKYLSPKRSSGVSSRGSSRIIDQTLLPHQMTLLRNTSTQSNPSFLRQSDRKRNNAPTKNRRHHSQSPLLLKP